MGFEIDHIEFHISVKRFYPRPLVLLLLPNQWLWYIFWRNKLAFFLHSYCRNWCSKFIV